MSTKTFSRVRSHSSSDAQPGTGKAHGASEAGQQKDQYRIVVMGAAAVGKTCIINRFLYENFKAEYKATVEELHQGEYSVNGATVTLDILDTTGSYAFPAMRKLSITTGDAFVLVYSLDNEESFEEIKALRQQILDTKLGDTDSEDEVFETPYPPIVIVGNKLDKLSGDNDIESLERNMPKVAVESLVNIEWNHGYVEASAKDDININGIFKELLAQCKVQMQRSPSLVRKNRRRSLPSMKGKRGDSCRVS